MSAVTIGLSSSRSKNGLHLFHFFESLELWVKCHCRIELPLSLSRMTVGRIGTQLLRGSEPGYILQRLEPGGWQGYKPNEKPVGNLFDFKALTPRWYLVPRSMDLGMD